MDKKYHSISEASKILGVKEQILRNLDGVLGKSLTVIRGRRYYKDADIEKLRIKLEAYAFAAPSLRGRPEKPDETIHTTMVSKDASEWIALSSPMAPPRNDEGSNNNLENLMRAMRELRAELTSALE